MGPVSFIYYVFLAVYTNQPIKTAICSYVVPDHILISLVFDSWGDEESMVYPL